MSKQYIERFLPNFIFCMILLSIFIILFEGNLTNQKTLSEKDYSTKINLTIMQDGTLNVEQVIDVNSNNYATYFFSNLPSRFNEYDYDENVENLKVYFNDKPLTSTENTDGYFNYRYCTSMTEKIKNSELVEMGIDSFNNIQVFMPSINHGKLKIAYDLKNYIVNYNDINYFEYDLKYDYNIFSNDVQFNIIMPKSTNEFLIMTNPEFNHSSLTTSLNDTTKQISLSGLKSDPLHIEVLFDRQISESDLKISEDKYDDLVNKFKKDRNNKIKLYIIMFTLLFISTIAVTSVQIIYRYHHFK
mgnify:CR=1 FL=1